MMIVQIIFIILVVAVLGSFIGAFTYRLPRGVGVVYGRSFCDNCKTPLAWIHNVPIVSYVIQKGKSFCCGKKISIRYPLIELASVLGALIIFLKFSPLLGLVYFILFLLCLSIFIIDFEWQYIPDELSFMIFLLSFIVGFSYEKILTGFVLAVFILTIHLVTKGKGMGLGDVKLALSLGSWLTLYNGLIFISGAFLTGGVVASILLFTSRAKLKQRIAFGPFLIVAFLYVFLLHS